MRDFNEVRNTLKKFSNVQVKVKEVFVPIGKTEVKLNVDSSHGCLGKLTHVHSLFLRNISERTGD